MWVKKDTLLLKVDRIELIEYKGIHTLQTTYNGYTVDLATFDNEKKAKVLYNKFIEAIKNDEKIFVIE